MSRTLRTFIRSSLLGFAEIAMRSLQSPLLSPLMMTISEPGTELKEEEQPMLRLTAFSKPSPLLFPTNEHNMLIRHRRGSEVLASMGDEKEKEA